MNSLVQRAETLVKALLARLPAIYIGGASAESEGSATLTITNPANGQPIGRTPAGKAEDVERAVLAARAASENGWRDTVPSERAGILWRAGDILESCAADLAILESLQTGKTFREAFNTDVNSSIAALRYYAGWATKRGGQIHELGGGQLGLSLAEPHPVVGVLLSFTSPLASAVWKSAAALAAGACVVLKPSELTPLTALRLAELFTKAALPAGVFNVVTGTGAQVGEPLALHNDVEAIAFQGSIETARRVMVASAKSNLKRVHLVLGGKSANIVFEDADLNRAISAAWKAIFTARGQTGTAGSRLLVHESLHDHVVSVVTERARELIVGDPLDDHTEMGPVISEAHMKRVLGYVEIGRREGARLVAGGSRDVEGAKSSGFFVKPTVFMDVDPSMRIAREEILGPVLSILRFRSEEEAIDLANGTDYGLASAIWTRDLARAHRVSRKLKSGVVWINQYDSVDPAMSVGGPGLSGHGRDLGTAGLDPWSSEKTIYLPSR